MAFIMKLLLSLTSVLHRKTIKPSCKSSSSMMTFAAQTEDNDSSRFQPIAEALNSMMQKLSFYNVTVVCGGRHFHTNRELLSAFSRFFESAFCKGWKETSSNVICLPLISPSSMNAILSYIYNRQLPEITHDETAMIKLLYDCDYLQMDELAVVTFKSISELYLKATRFIDITSCLEELGNQQCVLEIAAFLARNFCEIINSTDFLLLSASLLREVVRHQEMDKTQMDRVVISILKWTEADCKRITFLHGLLCILHAWCPECLIYMVNWNIKQKWSAEICYRLSLSRNIFLQNDKENCEGKLACFMENEIEKDHILGIIDSQNLTWIEKQKIPANYRAAVVSYRHHLYFFGGNPSKPSCIRTSSRFTKYCPYRKTILTSDESLLFPVYRSGVGLFNESIYIVNGLNADAKCVRSVQCYNPRNHRFHLVSPTNCGHLNPMVFSFNGALYIVGSITHDSNFVERYDSVCNQWTILTEIPTFCYQCSNTISGNQLYVLNHVGERYFHVYDLFAQSWTTSEFQGGPLRTVGLVAIDVGNEPAILAVDVNATLYKYDVQKSEWLTCLERCNKNSRLYVLQVSFLTI